MVLYLSPVTIGKITQYCQYLPPPNPQNGDIWFQTDGFINSIWIWNQEISHWLSASSFFQTESLDLLQTNPVFSGVIQLIPVCNTINGFGVFLTELLFTGVVSADNDLTNHWVFQLICGSNMGLPLKSTFLSSGVVDVMEKNINAKLLSASALQKLISLSVLQVGTPGNITGVLSLGYRLIYG